MTHYSDAIEAAETGYLYDFLSKQIVCFFNRPSQYMHNSTGLRGATACEVNSKLYRTLRLMQSPVWEMHFGQGGPV